MLPETPSTLRPSPGATPCPVRGGLARGLRCLVSVSFARALAPLILALLLASAPVAGQVRIEVLEGRAQLVTAERVEQLAPNAAPRASSAAGHLTVRAASRLRLTWPGRASVLVQGPAALEWHADVGVPGPDGAPGRAAAADTLVLAVVELGQLDVEVRRGVLQLSLPESWRASLCGVAVQLAALPSGAVELVHHAGAPVELEWTGERSASRPPIRVPAGSSVRLARPRHSPQESPLEAQRAPWPADADEWPWRAPSDTPELRAARVAQPRRTERPEGWRSGAEGAVGVQWVSHVESSDVDGRARLLPVAAGSDTNTTPGRGKWEDGARTRAERRAQERAAGVTSAQAPAAQAPPRVTVRPTPSAHAPPAAPEAAVIGVVALPPVHGEPVAPGAPFALPEGIAPSEPVALLDRNAPIEPIRFEPADWRGTPRTGLEGVGPIAVQRAPGVEVRALSARRVRVLVDGSVRGPVWCFAPGRDLRLGPGATVVFEADGSERMRLGAVESYEASPRRPRWDELGPR
jgi:hypothetical protein